MNATAKTKNLTYKGSVLATSYKRIENFSVTIETQGTRVWEKLHGSSRKP